MLNFYFKARLNACLVKTVRHGSTDTVYEIRYKPPRAFKGH